jgi:hypothetical protein
MQYALDADLVLITEVLYAARRTAIPPTTT